MANDARQAGAFSDSGRVLLVDDDPDVLTSARLLLAREDFKVLTARTPLEAFDLMAGTSVDAVLLDLNFSRGATSGEEGLTGLRDILVQDPDAVVVVMTGHSGVAIAVEAMRAGAADFISKPWTNARLLTTVRTAVELRRGRRRTGALQTENTALRGPATDIDGILGTSPGIQRLRTLIARAGPTEANVLILGENGVGKDLVARAVHAASDRASGPFIPVDLGALPEALFEAELFGHRRGAFPEAKADRPGRFVAAQGGTLFLDEIGNLPLALQIKLLSALERRQVTPLGGDRPVPIDVRIVAATNAPRAALYDETRFRADLLYRLNTVEIAVPPLRERGGDVLLLSRHYLALYARKYGRADKPISTEAETALAHDSWRGNVRALRHAMERAVILSETVMFEASDFALSVPAAVASPLAPATRSGSDTPDTATGSDLNLTRTERAAIETALKRHHYNVSHAAKALGLTRAALYRRMDKHGL